MIKIIKYDTDRFNFRSYIENCLGKLEDIHKNFDLKCYPCFLFKCKNHLELCENELTSEYAVKFIKNELRIN